MYKLVYAPDGITLSDHDVWPWCEAMLHQHDGKDVELLIAQIDIFMVFRAAACEMGKPEQVCLQIDGAVTPVNRYGAYLGNCPESPASEAAMMIINHSLRVQKEEKVKPITMLTPEKLAEVDAAILAFAPSNAKIDAIKAMRLKVDIGLREAKDYVESIFATYVADLEKKDCSDEMVEAHIKALWAYNKVNAIMWVRDRYHMDLREAKERTEDIVWREGVPQSDYEREESEE